MKPLMIFVVILGITSTFLAGCVYGLAGFLTSGFLCLGLLCFAIMWSACKASPDNVFSGMGVGFAMFIGFWVVLLLLEVIFGGGVSYKMMVLIVGPYSLDWDLANKYPELVDQTRLGFFSWVITAKSLYWTIPVVGGSLLTSVLVGAKLEK